MPRRDCTDETHEKVKVNEPRNKSGYSIRCNTCIQANRRAKYAEQEAEAQAARAQAKAEAEARKQEVESKLALGFVESWRALAEEDIGLALRIILVRYMLEQRGLSLRSDIAAESQFNRNTLYSAVRPDSIRPDDTPYVNNTISITRAHEVLDDIEDCITSLTLRHGSVYSISGSSPEVQHVFAQVLDQSRGEMLFYEAEDEGF